MKKIVAALLTLCIVSVVVPPVSDSGDSDSGISTYEYVSQTHDN